MYGHFQISVMDRHVHPFLCRLVKLVSWADLFLFSRFSNKVQGLEFARWIMDNLWLTLEYRSETFVLLWWTYPLKSMSINQTGFLILTMHDLSLLPVQVWVLETFLCVPLTKSFLSNFMSIGKFGLRGWLCVCVRVWFTEKIKGQKCTWNGLLKVQRWVLESFSCILFW